MIATADGYVTYVGVADRYRNVVEIMRQDGLVTRYEHLNGILITNVNLIPGGDIVGLIGSAGHSTRTHLHFETIINGIPVAPMSVVK